MPISVRRARPSSQAFRLRLTLAVLQLTCLILFGANTGLWSFTPSISIPIFTGGRNLANLRSAEVQEKIAVATYEKSIQTAFQEVADALATEGTVERELKERREFADAASQASELSSARYKHGAAAYTEVLDAQRTRYLLSRL